MKDGKSSRRNSCELSLEQLPEEIGALGALTELNCFQNALTRLPRSIASLGALVLLDVGENQLSALPGPELGAMRGLRVLRVGDEHPSLCRGLRTAPHP